MNRIQKLTTFLGFNRWQTSKIRQTNDIQIKKQAARKYPIDLLQTIRFPANARIVFYSNDIKAENALQSLYPNFEFVNPSNLTLGDSDEVLSSKVANLLIESKNPGVILKGYPFNANQARLLDYQLRGINLAIYFNNNDPSYESSIKDILNYYEQTGTLLRWNVKDSLEETMLRLKDTISTQIKLN